MLPLKPGIRTASLTSGFPWRCPTWHRCLCGISVIRLQYFAFVALTTTGFGDVVPETPQAEMLSVAIAISGTFYVAAVMALLIARFSSQQPP